MSKIILKRARRKEKKEKSGVVWVDVTPEGAGKPWSIFAPTYELKIGLKKKRITQERYIERYIKLLDHRMSTKGFSVPSAFRNLYRKTIMLTCTCRPTKFCHVDLLIDYLVKKYPNELKDGRGSPSVKEKKPEEKLEELLSAPPTPVSSSSWVYFDPPTPEQLRVTVENTRITIPSAPGEFQFVWEDIRFESRDDEEEGEE